MLLTGIVICLAVSVHTSSLSRPIDIPFILMGPNILRQEWENFKLKHGKPYDSTDEEETRLKIFVENTKFIAEHNDLYQKGVVSYNLEMNEFGDLTEKEVEENLQGYNSTLAEEDDDDKEAVTFIPPVQMYIPNRLDWRNRGAVTRVQNQNPCGSCWAFSAAGTLEGQYFRKTGILVELSEQNLIDCSQSYGNMGCKGGFVKKAFEYIKTNSGIDSEKSYPYEAHEGKCRYNKKYAVATDKGYVKIPPSEKSLQEAVVSVGPISVSVDSRGKRFRFYKSGVYYNDDCSSKKLTHSMLLVGYGKMNKDGSYWLIKNSWGEKWGDLGYIKMARNRHNNCGIATRALYPLV